MDYKIRPKINTKIIFNSLDKNIKNILIIGKKNLDIIEVLKNRKIKFEICESDNESYIFQFLETKDNFYYDLIIINLELSNFIKIASILNIVLNKGNVAIIRFRNRNNNEKITKKRQIEKIIKYKKIKILNKFYCDGNFCFSNVFFKLFTYYSVYFITKKTMMLNCEPNIINKIKMFFKIKKNKTILISKSEKYGK